MLRNWNVLKMSSLLTVAVALAPLPAAAQGQADAGDTELEKLSKLVKELKKTCEEQKDTSSRSSHTCPCKQGSIDYFPSASTFRHRIRCYTSSRAMGRIEMQATPKHQKIPRK